MFDKLVQFKNRGVRDLFIGHGLDCGSSCLTNMYIVTIEALGVDAYNIL